MAEKLQPNPAFERYMNNEPLTPELAVLKEGIQAEEIPVKGLPARSEQENTERNLTRSERSDLRELMAMPGWNLVERIQEKAYAAHEKVAINNSKNNPLARGEEIAAEWAYVVVYRRVMNEMKQLLQVAAKDWEEEQP